MSKLFLGQEVVSIKSAGAGTIKVCISLGFSIKKNYEDQPTHFLKSVW